MSAETPARIQDMIDKLRGLLDKVNKRSGDGIQLTIEDGAYVEEGGWVHLIVTPSKAGARVYEYVALLNELEGELRKDVGEQVLLVPAALD